MKDTSGYIVSFIKPNKENPEKPGIIQYGFLYHKDQDMFKKHNKAMVMHVDNNFKPEKDDKGKQIISVIPEDSAKIVGFLD